jgi:mannan endo-1,4-beta-mannosidase
MLFDRLARFHQLDNLLWVYNCNELNANVDPYETHFPGHDLVDVLATDVYHCGFARKDYDRLLALAGDKPIAIGECGVAPPAEVLRDQPRWAWFMLWGDAPGGGPGGAAFRAAYANERTLTWDRLPWVTSSGDGPRIHDPILK